MRPGLSRYFNPRGVTARSRPRPGIALAKAVAAGDTEAIFRILALHVDWHEPLNAADAALALCTAAGIHHSGAVHGLEQMLQAGFDPDAQDVTGNHALHRASQAGNLNALRLLLDHGAFVDAWQGNRTALMFATLNGHVDCLALLLERGANVNIATSYGTNALICAAAAGQLECLDLLLRAGANLEAKLKSGCSLQDLVCGSRMNRAAVKARFEREQACRERARLEATAHSPVFRDEPANFPL